MGLIVSVINRFSRWSPRLNGERNMSINTSIAAYMIIIFNCSICQNFLKTWKKT